MPEELETVLRLVAEGKLTPDEASPIIDALTRAEQQTAEPDDDDRRTRSVDGLDRLAAADAGHARHARSGRQLRIRVTERGRQVVNLRIPIGFVETALQFVPGLGGDQTRRIRDAVQAGTTGAIVDIEEEDGSGVLISVE